MFVVASPGVQVAYTEIFMQFSCPKQYLANLIVLIFRNLIVACFAVFRFHKKDK